METANTRFIFSAIILLVVLVVFGIKNYSNSQNKQNQSIECAKDGGGH